MNIHSYCIQLHTSNYHWIQNADVLIGVIRGVYVPIRKKGGIVIVISDSRVMTAQNVSVCIYVCTYVCINICIYEYKYKNIWLCIYIYIYTYIWTYIYMYLHVYIYIYISISMHIYIYTYIDIYSNIGFTGDDCSKRE
jgi:hypothetical protein